MTNVLHISVYVLTLGTIYGGTALATRRVGGRVIDGDDRVAYLLTFAGVAVGLPTTSFLLLRWDDPINVGAAAVVLGAVVAAVRLRRRLQ
jgi:hypothetical protein